jgi:hypothetical protein
MHRESSELFLELAGHLEALAGRQPALELPDAGHERISGLDRQMSWRRERGDGNRSVLVHSMNHGQLGSIGQSRDPTWHDSASGRSAGAPR